MSDVFIMGRHDGIEVWGFVTNEQLWTNDGVVHLFYDDPVLGQREMNVFIDTVDIDNTFPVRR